MKKQERDWQWCWHWLWLQQRWGMHHRRERAGKCRGIRHSKGGWDQNTQERRQVYGGDLHGQHCHSILCDHP